MRPLASIPGPLTLAWALTLVCACPPHADAARAPKSPSGSGAPVAADSARVERRPIAVERAASDEALLRLGRAAMERRIGNMRGVIENLEAIDFSGGPTFPDADRAAFLLGEAYLEIGARARFVSLARQVSGWQRESPYTRWIAFELAIVATESPAETASAVAGTSAPNAAPDSLGIPIPSAPAAGARTTSGGATADALAAGVLLRDGNPAGALALLTAAEARGETSPLLTYLKAQALAATGGDAGPEWQRLAASDTGTRLGRDLAGAAGIRLATEALKRGEDPRGFLERVPAGSAYGPRARHMLGLAAIERGDTTGAVVLQALARDDSGYVARREVWQALAGEALDQGSWENAYRIYREIDHDWAMHRDILKRLHASADLDSLWRTWEGNTLAPPGLMLDMAPGATIARGLADTSADLRERPEAALPDLESPALEHPSPYAVPPPSPEVWKAVAQARGAMENAAGELSLTRWERVREEERLSAMRRYLAFGLGRARSQADSLAGYASLLDSLRATLEALDARLKAVRDEATRRMVRRTMVVLEECAGNLLWMDAMRVFHLDPASRARTLPAPPGYPDPDSVLAGEERVARAVEALARRLIADAPALIARSYAEAWRPGMIDRAAQQDSLAHASWAWARSLAGTIDSTLAAAASSEQLRRLAARADSLAAESERLAAGYAKLRADGARTAIQAALTALEDEREGIDYGLAASAYGLGVRLPAPGADSLLAGVTARGDSTAVDELDLPEAVRWRAEAVTLHRAFLEQHPDSPARGEMRFRLADLLLVAARHEFREQMAAYVQDQQQGGAGHVPLPVLSHSEPLSLYRSILAEDPGFEHLDAVLFNAGMILADEGEPEAEKMFTRLVSEHPSSPYCQEATLRMGDMRFNEKRYAESIDLYRRAAQGADAGLTAIALYKTGWANFNQDRYAEAAEAFGAVLDLYRSERRPEIEADVEGEAETYLVQSLAGAGGAPAFEAHFGKAGHKPYEQRILMALGQHFRRFGQYDQAVIVDELCLKRYPDSADALLSAQRLIDTHQRARKPDRAREARLSFSARFAPGSDWARAQSSDSVRTAGAEFARTSLRTVAQEYHQRARTTHAPADWRAALDLYQQVLKSWPDDADAPSTALKAGEAATQLGEYSTALGHYQRAAAGSDSIAAQAMWQRVAVTDEWYESTRGQASPGKPRAATGQDSLARAVLRTADELRARFPDHPRAADLLWREGNLAFAHGWLDSSAARFGELASRHPGDARAPRAAILRADAMFRLGRYDQAGPAYEQALTAARAVHSDTLARRAAQAIPVTYYKLAESAVAEDSSRFERHAELFQQVATRWPRYEFAPRAQYRAGLAWARAGKTESAVTAMEAVIDSFPKSEYVRDAHLEIARAWEKGGEKEKAAAAYVRFAEHYPKEKGAADAWLKAADLYAAAGKDGEAQKIRLAYIKRYPNDVETAMEVYEGLAQQELKTVGPERPISSLLPAPVKTVVVKGKRGKAKRVAVPAAKGAAVVPPSYLSEYLRRAEANPKLASHAILAQVAFLKAEESRPAYEALRIRQPLPPSIAAKQKSLDRQMWLYKQCVDQGVAEWAHAATFRIGEALVNFGDALEKSERPPDLTGDGLAAYEDVLFDRARAFGERGEGVWTDLLKQSAGKDDAWTERAQGALWHRLGDRFAYRPETDYPLVNAKSVDRKEPVEEAPAQKGSAKGSAKSSAKNDRNAKPAPKPPSPSAQNAQPEGSPR